MRKRHFLAGTKQNSMERMRTNMQERVENIIQHLEGNLCEHRNLSRNELLTVYLVAELDRIADKLDDLADAISPYR